jgi:hypothetical protein
MLTTSSASSRFEKACRSAIPVTMLAALLLWYTMGHGWNHRVMTVTKNLQRRGRKLCQHKFVYILPFFSCQNHWHGNQAKIEYRTQ